jgi:hypothetical protein
MGYTRPSIPQPEDKRKQWHWENNKLVRINSAGEIEECDDPEVIAQRLEACESVARGYRKLAKAAKESRAAELEKGAKIQDLHVTYLQQLQERCK